MKKLVLSISLIALTGSVFAQANITDPPQAPPPPPAANPALPPRPPLPQGPKLKSLPLGSEIPNSGLMMPSALGDPISLQSATTEKGLLVLFSGNTCRAALKSQRQILELMNTAKALGVGMAVLNSNEKIRQNGEDMGQMHAFAEQWKYSAPYLMDNMAIMADQFGASNNLEVFLFNASGKLVYKGALLENPLDPDKSKHFFALNALKNMVAGKPIKPQETKSVGCEIQRMQM
ncbi:MAG: hypothetical protein JST06_10890 [Bacteroidetes bacterium]|nr:hypothetical protein [Bacteroidota bacterium]MBS1630352.1 hypothetical protein [Bacteroidota bacterium]